MNLTYHSDLEITDEYIRINYREYDLLLFTNLMFKHLNVTDFYKMCRVISWSLPDDEELLQVAEILACAITDCPRDKRVKDGFMRRLTLTLAKRGIDLYV